MQLQDGNEHIKVTSWQILIELRLKLVELCLHVPADHGGDVLLLSSFRQARFPMRSKRCNRKWCYTSTEAQSQQS